MKNNMIFLNKLIDPKDVELLELFNYKPSILKQNTCSWPKKKYKVWREKSYVLRLYNNDIIFKKMCNHFFLIR